MNVTVEFDDPNLLIAEVVWNDLRTGKSTVALSSVRSTALETLKRGGAFMIYRNDIGIMRRFDRLSEFETYLSEIDDQRKRLGLETLEP